MQNILNIYTIFCKICPFPDNYVSSSAENTLTRVIREWYAENLPRQLSEPRTLKVNNSKTRSSNRAEDSRDHSKVIVE